MHIAGHRTGPHRVGGDAAAEHHAGECWRLRVVLGGEHMGGMHMGGRVGAEC